MLVDMDMKHWNSIHILQTPTHFLKCNYMLILSSLRSLSGGLVDSFYFNHVYSLTVGFCRLLLIQPHLLMMLELELEHLEPVELL